MANTDPGMPELDPVATAELNEAASHVRFGTGKTYAESLAALVTARDVHGISPQEYVENKLYLVPFEKFPELSQRNRFVELVSQRKRIPYERAYAMMFDIRTRFGINFREFTEQKLYSYSSEEGLQNAVRRLIERESRHIQQVCLETGWSIEEAEQKMRATKRRWPTIDFRKYSGYGFFANTDEEISERVKKWETTAKENRETVMRATGWPEGRVRKHMTRFQIVYDIIPAYYMCYRGWELTDEQINSYARQKLSQRLSNLYNVNADTALLGRKDKFDEIYAEYANRKFWVNEPGASFEQFREFAEGLGEAFCKPLRSGGGLGTFKIDLKVRGRKLRSIYEDLMRKPLVLVEESFAQHAALSEFYPNSVNTVRVVTIEVDGVVEIISTGVRFGSQGITDNFSADGIVCDVDKETGVILTAGVNKKGEVHEVHPHSGKRFEGFQIPHWEKVIAAARGAMSVMPGVNFVGWDIAVGDDKVSIIEGNSMPDLVLVQAPYAPKQIGKRYLFDPYIERGKKAKNEQPAT